MSTRRAPATHGDPRCQCTEEPQHTIEESVILPVLGGETIGG